MTTPRYKLKSFATDHQDHQQMVKALKAVPNLETIEDKEAATVIVKVKANGGEVFRSIQKFHNGPWIIRILPGLLTPVS